MAQPIAFNSLELVIRYKRYWMEAIQIDFWAI